MQKLRSVPAILAVFVLAAFYILFVRHRVPFIAINLIFLMIAPIGYIYAGAAAYLAIAFSWLSLYPIFVYIFRIDPLNAAMPLLVFNCLLLACFGYKNIIRREEKLWGRSLKDSELARSRLNEECRNAEDLEAKIKSKEIAIINLYEITKKMSEGLKFEDIFETLSVFLKDNFTFRRCSLIVLKHEEDRVIVDREYSVWCGRHTTRATAYGDKPDFNRLARIFIEGSGSINISRTEDPKVFEDLGIGNPQVGTFVAMPLLSEKKIVGMLAIENLPKADIERLTILSAQFALEIKKILLYEMVERLAITDSLTGLYVRRHFYDRLNEELKRSKRYGLSFAFLMVDIDDFKRCNDTYGHLVGDVVLKDMVRVIKENVREIDIVSRYGGEEMALVLPETAEESALIVAERLRAKIGEHLFNAYDEKLRLTVSIGVSLYPKDSDDAKAIVEKADEALYAAKKSGKNVVCAYKKEYNNPN